MNGWWRADGPGKVPTAERVINECKAGWAGRSAGLEQSLCRIQQQQHQHRRLRLAGNQAFLWLMYDGKER